MNRTCTFKNLNQWLTTLAVFVLISASAVAATKTQARLVLSSDTARAGETVLAGVHLKMAPGWHTYWRYGGDSGAPTKIEWTLPTSVTAGDIQWPIPEKYIAEGLTTYVYHDEVVLIVPLKLAADLKPGSLAIKADVKWLECEKLCIPGSAEVNANLTIGDAPKLSADAPLIEKFRGRLPLAGTTFAATASWEKAANGEARPLIIEWSAPGTLADADFFPYAAGDFEVGAATEKLSAAGVARIRKEVKKSAANWPSRIAGVVIQKSDAATAPLAYDVNLTVGEKSMGAGASAVNGSAGSAEKTKTLWEYLIFAFIGGLILNLMPCVLPVIALKVLGFVQQSKEDPATVRKHGLVYMMGVIVSFLVLASVVIGVQHAGKLAGWGMQFGDPRFVVVMTVLVTLVALNLFGLFEVILGGGATTTAMELSSKEGSAGAFFNGVFATVLATPCTAPFLGAALGFAFRQPSSVIVLIFVTIALGLAAPYVALSWNPAWMKFLPKPGAWMEKFKIAMGFPMLATAMWLGFDVGAAHFGKKSFWLGIFLVILAVVAWIWGEFVQRGRKRKGISMAIALTLLVGGYVWVLEKQLHWRSPAKLSGAGEIEHEAGGIAWQAWSADAVAKARAEGRVVFVDFTADWCVTCQANKKTSIEISSVRAKLKELNAVALLGDYTLVPEAMTKELNKYGRAGVPLVLVYPKDASQPAMVLPELLTPGIVLEALDKANK